MMYQGSDDGFGVTHPSIRGHTCNIIICGWHTKGVGDYKLTTNSVGHSIGIFKKLCSD